MRRTIVPLPLQTEALSAAAVPAVGGEQMTKLIVLLLTCSELLAGNVWVVNPLRSGVPLAKVIRG